MAESIAWASLWLTIGFGAGVFWHTAHTDKHLRRLADKLRLLSTWIDSETLRPRAKRVLHDFAEHLASEDSGQ